MKNRAPHTLAPKVLLFSNSDQSDLKLDYDAITPKPATFDPYDSEFWQILNFQPCQCLRLGTSQCQQNITAFQIILNNYRLFWIVSPLPSQKMTLRRCQSNHWLSFSTKTIFDHYQIAHPTARPKDYLAPFQARLPLPLPAARS